MADYYVRLPATGPATPVSPANGGTGISSYATGDTLYASATNVLSKLPIGGQQQVLTVNASGVPAWENTFNPSNILQWCEDWDGTGSSGTLGWNGNSAGGTVNTAAPDTAGHAGILRMYPNGNGTTAVVYKDNSYLCGGGVLTFEMLLSVTTLSSSAGSNATYTAIYGPCGAYDALPAVTGMWFSYTDSANSGKWVCHSSNDNNTTAVNTNTAVVAGAWTKLKIVAAADGSSVDYFIDGVNVGTISTAASIPTNHSFGIALAMKQTNAGTNNPTNLIDYVSFSILFTTPR